MTQFIQSDWDGNEHWVPPKVVFLPSSIHLQLALLERSRPIPPLHEPIVIHEALNLLTDIDRFEKSSNPVLVGARDELMGLAREYLNSWWNVESLREQMYDTTEDYVRNYWEALLSLKAASKRSKPSTESQLSYYKSDSSHLYLNWEKEDGSLDRTSLMWSQLHIYQEWNWQMYQSMCMFDATFDEDLESTSSSSRHGLGLISNGTGDAWRVTEHILQRETTDEEVADNSFER
jgi:hypothetical protein